MKLKNILTLFCFTFAILLVGCSSPLKEEPVEDLDEITVGHFLKVKNTDERLTLLDKKDALAADGLYYAAWVAGKAEPYENSDGDTVDLYDAQLYLLLGEAKSSEAAQSSMDTWLGAAKTNYEIVKEEEISCNGQSYTILAYNCKSADNPYDRGVSAFGTFASSAVCIELTCREQFEEEIETMLTDFLNNCEYSAK